jgi:ATP-binding cassette subfamily A (ABC1) protein 3
LGSGYIVTVGLEVNASIISSSQAASNLLGDIQTVAPTCQKRHLESIEGGSGKIEYHLGTKDPRVVQSALQQVDNTHEGFVVRDVDVRGASLEGVFLDLMAKEDTMNQRPSDVDTEDKMDPNEKEHSTLTVPMLGSHPSDITVAAATPPTLALTSGRPRSFLQQTLTIFHKRILIARRAWLTPFLALLIAVAGSCIPQVFLKDVGPACQRRPYTPPPSESLFLTSNPWWNYLDVYDNMTAAQGQPNPNEYKLIAKPPQVLGELGIAMASVKPYGLDSESTFNDLVNSKFRNISFGGVSFGNSSAETQVTFAWEAHEPGSNAPVLLNLVNNIRLNRALNTTSRGTPATGPTLIVTDYGRFPYAAGGTLTALKWVVFFGLAMAVYPAFFSTYVARERRAGVQAMQLSNGLSNPAGLWLGHLMFDGMICVLAATAITLSFRLGSGEFYGLGYMVSTREEYLGMLKLTLSSGSFWYYTDLQQHCSRTASA